MEDRWQLILRRREALDTLFALYLASVANCDFIGIKQQNRTIPGLKARIEP